MAGKFLDYLGLEYFKSKLSAEVDEKLEAVNGATPATSAPKAAGTAAVGTSTKFAREDHVHPVQTSVSGNAGTATKLASARNIGLTGDVSGSASFDGAADATINATLANSGVTAGSYGPTAAATLAFGGSVSVPQVTVDAKGRVTTVTNRAIKLPAAPTSVSGNAGTATKLATARTVQTNLASSSAASFDGSGNISPGVTGVLPIANGGTGSSSKNFVDLASAQTVTGDKFFSGDVVFQNGIRGINLDGSTEEKAIDLNDCVPSDNNTLAIYNCISNANSAYITNKPMETQCTFILYSYKVRWYSETDAHYYQQFISAIDHAVYERWNVGGTWKTWARSMPAVTGCDSSGRLLWRKWHDGTIEQFGKAYIANGSTGTRVVFHVAFPNEVKNIQCTASGGIAASCTAAADGLGAATIKHNGNGGINVDWYAIGR